MKKVAYQYKPWGNSLTRQSSPPPTETPPPNERRFKSGSSLFSTNRRRPESLRTTTTTTTVSSLMDLDTEPPTYNPPTEASREGEEEEEVKDEVKTVRPELVRHEYRYEAPFQDHGGHGEPIGTSHFVEDVDLKATETSEPMKPQSNGNGNEGVSIDEDKRLFENFELPLPRIKSKTIVKEDDGERSKIQSQEIERKPAQEAEFNESSSKSPLQSVSSAPKDGKSLNGKKHPPSKTLENSGGLSSSILDELAGIPGGAGRDYPALHKIPEEIDFSCKGRASGFYADMNLRCQVYHHCNHGSFQSFICPNGTIFNQEISVCSWWFNVDCSKAEQFYELNNKPRPETLKSTTSRPVNPSMGPDNSSRRPVKNRIIYKQSPALEESFFRETPRSSYLTTHQYYNNRSRRRHRYNHQQNSDQLFPFF